MEKISIGAAVEKKDLVIGQQQKKKNENPLTVKERVEQNEFGPFKQDYASPEKKTKQNQEAFPLLKIDELVEQYPSTISHKLLVKHSFPLSTKSTLPYAQSSKVWIKT